MTRLRSNEDTTNFMIAKVSADLSRLTAGDLIGEYDQSLPGDSDAYHFKAHCLPLAVRWPRNVNSL